MAGAQHLSPQYVVDGSCTACGACLLTCPTAAFVVGVPLRVDADRCTDCGACVEVCPADAITRVPPADQPRVVARRGAPRPRAVDQRGLGSGGVRA